MSDGGTETWDGAPVALSPAPLGLTMLGTKDAETCTDGLCGVPGADSGS